MKAVILTAFGGPENLVDAERPKPRVKPEQVLIRVKAAAFNPVDYQVREAGFPSLTPPIILGKDVAGVIEEIGTAAKSFRPGDEVISYLGGPSLASGYAEFVAVPWWFVAKKPKGLSFADAATIPLTGLTALQSLKRAKFDKSKSILIAGGAGGVGSWAIQIAKAMGYAHLVTTAGSSRSRSFLTGELGLKPNQIVDYAGLDRAALAHAAIRANEGKLFEISLDCVGGAMTHLCVDAVDFEGTVVSIVNGPKDASHAPDASDENTLFDKSASFHFELLFAVAEFAPAERQLAYAGQLNELVGMIERGQVKLPTVTVVGPLSAATVREAHRRLESGHTTGKLVATVG
jgi:NADPH:quinone reductase